MVHGHPIIKKLMAQVVMFIVFIRADKCHISCSSNQDLLGNYRMNGRSEM